MTTSTELSIYDHARDSREPDARPAPYWNYSAAELANLRALTCQECGERGCQFIECEGPECGRHARHLTEVREGITRIYCDRCIEVRHCASCNGASPRYLLVPAEGERFCETCAHRDPLETT